MAAPMKVRSRKGGAAIPLDETDKSLLNLLQGSFPIARARPSRIQICLGSERWHRARPSEQTRSVAAPRRW